MGIPFPFVLILCSQEELLITSINVQFCQQLRLAERTCAPLSVEILLCTIMKYYMAIAVCPSICGKANKLIDLSKDITGADKWQLVKIIVIIIIILIIVIIFLIIVIITIILITRTSNELPPSKLFGFIDTLRSWTNFSFYDAVGREKKHSRKCSFIMIFGHFVCNMLIKYGMPRRN